MSFVTVCLIIAAAGYIIMIAAAYHPAFIQSKKTTQDGWITADNSGNVSFILWKRDWHQPQEKEVTICRN